MTVFSTTAVVGALCAPLLLIAGPADAASVVVASWHMDEAVGATTMVDSSGNNNSGTISKVKVGQPGYAGNGYEFAGAGIVTVKNSATLNPSGSPFSVALRFKSSTRPTSSVGDYDLIRKGLSSTSGGDWKMEILKSGKVFCLFRGSSAKVTLTGTTNVVNGAWHLLECRTTATGTQLLVDGAAQASTASRPGNISNSSVLTVGAKNASEDQTTGVLDEVLIQKG
jgi:hypothetical protein